MFLALTAKECRIWLKNILFYAYVIILFVFYVSQMGSGDILVEPVPGRDDYGIAYTSDENVIMNQTLKNLMEEYDRGSFTTYPVGFYKEVIVSEKEGQELEKIISYLTGMELREWKKQLAQYWETDGQWSFSVDKSISFGQFKEAMKKVSGIVGRGSAYEEESLRRAEIPQTYEQALEEYEKICSVDKVTGAYARLFCDYLGILAGILPAFFGVARVLQDRRSRAEQVLYTKYASSKVVVAARYVAMVLVMFVPVLVISCFSLTQSVYMAGHMAVVPDYLAYVKYCVLWILPTILFVTAVSYVTAELTESILALLVNGVIWFGAVFGGFRSGLTFVGWNMIPRFNTIGETKLFQSLLPQLIRNRAVYSGLAVVLVLAGIAIYEIKRRGGLGYGRKISENRSGQHEI